MLVIAGMLFVVAQVSINAVNGWWLDELFTLGVSDSSLPFWRAFVERIAPDSNPPLYFSLVYAVRLFISDDRLALLLLNIGFLAAGSGAVLASARPSGKQTVAALAVAAFLLSGPVLAYAPEGRAYLAALTIAFCASWFALLSVWAVSRQRLWPFVVLGGLAALLHVYAALYCGALAAGMLVLALMDRSRRDLVAPSLALGISSTAVVLVWVLTALHSMGNVDWIEFSLQSVRDAIWYVRSLAVGNVFALLLLATLLVYGLVRPATRSIVIVFGIAFALFAALPLAVSLKKPLIAGRYWLIGAPGLIVLVAGLAEAWYGQVRNDGLNRPARLALAGVLVLAAMSTVSGFLTARQFTAPKPIWEGAAIVRPLLEKCAPASVHVGIAQLNDRGPIWSFAYTVGQSPALFTDVAAPATKPLAAAQASCPVLAWAEHVLLGHDFTRSAADAELLKLVKVEAAPGEVEIRRHRSGFVVLKRGATAGQRQ